MQTTRVVCTDYGWSLQKVLRTYKFKCAHSLKYLCVLTKVFTSYSLQCLRVLIETSTSYSFYCCCYWRAPTGRYSCKAQGASPGLLLKHIYWAPKGRHFPKPNALTVSAAPAELLILLFAVFPGFHIGLCPHFTLGYEEYRAYGTHNTSEFWCGCPASIIWERND